MYNGFALVAADDSWSSLEVSAAGNVMYHA
jgi:hypothetical protein